MKTKIIKYFSYLVITTSLVILAIIENAFPVDNFKYNFACYLSLLIAVYLITNKRLFSALLTSLIIFGILLISFKKIDLIGARLISDDVLFAVANPLFLWQFIDIKAAIFLALFLALLVYSYKVESDSVRRKILLKLVLIAPLIFYVFNSPSEEIENYKNIVADDVRTKNLMYFAMSFSSKFQLQLPSPVEQNEKFCCAHAKFEDLKIKSTNYKPNIIIILMESTFDISKINKSIVGGFGGIPYTPIKTYVAGGGTWVQEYAVLHGVPPTVYGDFFKAINTLGPRRLDGRIAPALSEIGYKTKTFSTSKKDFYGADHFHHSLGMKEYFTIWDMPETSEQDSTEKDATLLNFLFQNIQAESEPSFIFVTTELNHAPHHNKMLDTNINCANWDEEKCSIVSEYLSREKSFVELFQRFSKKLSTLSRDSIVILFGDHVPADINDRFQESDFSNKNKFETIALIYDSRKSSYVKIESVIGCVPKKIEISDLDVISLKLAGFESVYSKAKFANKIIPNCQ